MEVKSQKNVFVLQKLLYIILKGLLTYSDLPCCLETCIKFYGQWPSSSGIVLMISTYLFLFIYKYQHVLQFPFPNTLSNFLVNTSIIFSWLIWHSSVHILIIFGVEEFTWIPYWTYFLQLNIECAWGCLIQQTETFWGRNWFQWIQMLKTLNCLICRISFDNAFRACI